MKCKRHFRYECQQGSKGALVGKGKAAAFGLAEFRPVGILMKFFGRWREVRY